jgi:sugar lactone lactonase YvrE/DNA-binding IclR family transcriptional regulator
MSDPAEPRSGAALIEKAIVVLDAVSAAARPMRLTDLMPATGLPRSTLHRILGALVAGGLLRFERAEGHYRLGFRLFEMAHRAWSDIDLRAIAAPAMEALRDLTGETVLLALLDGDAMVQVDRRDSKQPLRAALAGLAQLPLHASAPGKAVLSWMEPEQRDATTAQLPLAAITAHTITDRAALAAALDLAKARLYALDDEEHAEGLRGVAAPILDHRQHPVAAIAVYGPASRLPPARLHEIALHVVDAARRATHDAGHVSHSLHPDPRPAAAPPRGLACVLDARALLGESPVWDAKAQALYWLDILGPALHRFDPATRRDTAWPMAELVAALVLRRAGGLVVGLRDRFAAFDPRDGSLRPLASLAPMAASARINDARCDGAGRLWSGTMDMGVRPDRGALFRVAGDGTVARVLHPVTLSNGLGWSPDGRTMYFTDTAARAILAFDFDAAAGTIANRRVFASVPERAGRPNGLAVDREGAVWSVRSDGWRVVRYRPDGRLEREVVLPVPRPTGIAFGGRDLDTLYIASARVRLPIDVLEEAPLSGGLFAVKPGVRGLPEGRFAG